MNNKDLFEKNVWFDTKKCFIDGEWITPQSNSFLPLLNPSNGQEICKIAKCNEDDVNFAVESARN